MLHGLSYLSYLSYPPYLPQPCAHDTPDPYTYMLTTYLHLSTNNPSTDLSVDTTYLLTTHLPSFLEDRKPPSTPRPSPLLLLRLRLRLRLLLLLRLLHKGQGKTERAGGGERRGGGRGGRGGGGGGSSLFSAAVGVPAAAVGRCHKSPGEPPSCAAGEGWGRRAFGCGERGLILIFFFIFLVSC